MSEQARRGLFLVGAAGFAAVLLWGLLALPDAIDFEDFVSNYYLDVGVRDRNSFNLVSAVIFDYRGLDTMGEQLILFASVTAVALLLRMQRTETDAPPLDALPGRDVPPTSGALQLAGTALAGIALLTSLYVILHAQFTPGGGFQSGVLTAGGVLALYLADEYDTFARLTSERVLEQIEAVSAGAYIVVGLVGLVVAGSFLTNIGPMGTLGELVSSGTIVGLNIIIWFEVTAGFLLIFSHFLEQTVRIHERIRR
ncbi:MAG: sodium:proton antiporter [Actinomycetota bacterium]|nr:sodium:proton antiporter [Actinomycetota bacterium]